MPYFQMVNRTFGMVWKLANLDDCKRVIASRQYGRYGVEVVTDIPDHIEIIAIDEWEMPDTYQIYTVCP